MCEHPLKGTPSRPAEAGDRLVVHRFPIGALGFASASQLNLLRRESGSLWEQVKRVFGSPCGHEIIAVLIPHGARLVLYGIPRGARIEFRLNEIEQAIFTKVYKAAGDWRDGVDFRNGRMVFLQSLPEGQQVFVLSLPERATELRERFSIGASV